VVLVTLAFERLAELAVRFVLDGFGTRRGRGLVRAFCCVVGRHRHSSPQGASSTILPSIMP
jgi:hypothetical protein